MSELVERFQDYVAALSAEGERLEEVSERGLQFALILLLVQVLRADLEVKDDELDVVAGAVQEILGLRREEAVELMRAAAHAARDSERVVRAMDHLGRRLSHPQRRQLLEWLWRVALADAEILAEEEYLIRKVSERLGLRTADIIEAKVRAKDSFR